MAWVRLDDTFPEHPKVLAAGGEAAWLHVCALAYCNRHATDGFVPAAIVPRLCDRRAPLALVSRLVSVGLWSPSRDGYEINDYLEYQPSKEENEARRAKRAEAGRKGGIRSGETRRSKAEANASRLVEAESNPVPSRPVPSNPPTPRRAEVLDVYLRIARERATTPIRSEAGFAKHMLQSVDEESLSRWLELFPTAPPGAIAGWLHGDKGSMRYYPRADELAPVTELRRNG